MSNTQPRFDTLEYANELQDAGFSEQQAKVQARALFRVIDQQLATKQDLKALESKLSMDMKELETKLSYDIKELETKVSLEIKELDVKIKELDVKLTHEIQEVRRDVAEMGKDIVIKLGSIVASLFAVSGVIVAILFRFVH